MEVAYFDSCPDAVHKGSKIAGELHITWEAGNLQCQCLQLWTTLKHTGCQKLCFHIHTHAPWLHHIDRHVNNNTTSTQIGYTQCPSEGPTHYGNGNQILMYFLLSVVLFRRRVCSSLLTELVNICEITAWPCINSLTRTLCFAGAILSHDALARVADECTTHSKHLAPCGANSPTHKFWHQN